jgi:hypothetical protein
MKMVAAIAVGLGLGLGGAALFLPEASRGARLVALFDAHCVPFARTRVAPEPSGLEPVEDVPGEKLRIEKTPGIALEFDDHSCQVSDVLGHVPAEDHAEIDAAVRELIPRVFPDLALDVDADDPYWDRFEVWMQYPKDDPRHWALTYTRFAARGDHAATALRVGFSPD